MDYQAYRKAFFVDPTPQPKHQIGDVFGLSLFFAEYEEAAAYYSKVLGSPQYVEGENTKGWKLGGAWLTLLRAVDCNPTNAEIQLTMANEEEADELQAAFTQAGGTGEESEEALMYEPVKIYPISDPFGNSILLVVRK